MRLSKSCLGEKEKAAALTVLESEFLGMGPGVQKFETELKTYLNTKGSVVCVNTGTSALHLACQAAGFKAGDEVLVPSLTFVASFHAIRATGATPVACDVHRTTGLLDLDDATKRLTSRTKGLMFVEYASEVHGVEEAYQWARSKGLRFISDSAHSFGCESGRKKIGSFGDIICFSFDGIKNITCGEGGAVVSEDEEVLERVRNARLLGIEKDSERRYLKQRSWDFDVKEPGWRYHMGEMAAAIGRVQLERFERDFVPSRIHLSALYRKQLANSDLVELYESSHDKYGNRIVQHIFPVKVKRGKKAELRDFLNSKGIEVGVHYKPAHLLTYFKEPKLSLPKVEALYEMFITLPLHPDLSDVDVEQVTGLIQEFEKKL